VKLFFDQNLSYRLVRLVENVFPDSSHVARHDLHRADDIDIWNFAGANQFTVVSKDEDFYHIASLAGPPPHFIWIRSGNLPTESMGNLLLSNQLEIQNFVQTDNGVLELFA